MVHGGQVRLLHSPAPAAPVRHRWGRAVGGRWIVTLPQEVGLVFEAFERNARVNRAVLATLDMPMLDHDDGMGGFSIGQHFADMVSFRREWLRAVAPEEAERVPDAIDISSTMLRSWRYSGPVASRAPASASAARLDAR